MIELINGIIIIKEYTKVLLIKKASVSHIETISNKVIRIITQNGPVDVFFNKIDTDMTYSEYVSYLKANVLANSTFTKVLSDESYTISAGFISGALNNIGDADASFTGNMDGSGAVDIPKGECYVFSEDSSPYGSITVDATGTEIHIALNY